MGMRRPIASGSKTLALVAFNESAINPNAAINRDINTRQFLRLLVQWDARGDVSIAVYPYYLHQGANIYSLEIKQTNTSSHRRTGWAVYDLYGVYSVKLRFADTSGTSNRI